METYRDLTRGEGWSPYLAGALSGLLIILSVWLTGNFVGASTSFARSVGMLESLISPTRTARIEYFREVRPVIDWQWMFVAGILLGSFISAITSRSFRIQALPGLWEERFGGSRLKRSLVAFAGGAIMLFGARLAGGCTSGQGLSGTLQLAVSGFLTLAFIFAGGILTANAMYKGGRR